MEPKKTEFHTIDALRFFAFLKVYLLHLPVERDFGLFSTMKKGGGIGVVFFFVLSGFLITYILTSEKQSTDRIGLGHFYAKRILRIWPLFYLFLGIVYLMPHDMRVLLGYEGGGYTPDWRASFAFLENYQIIRHHSAPALGPLMVTWSLCIEEHFYILWGITVALLPVRRIPVAMSVLILAAIAGRVAALHFLPGYDVSTNEIVTSMDYFACGGLVGYLYASRRETFERFIMSIPLVARVMYLTFAVVFVFLNGRFFAFLHIPGWLHPLLQSVVFAAVIAIVLPAQSPIRIGHSHPLSYLGRISYGLYLFHGLVIMAVFQYFGRHGMHIDTMPLLLLFLTVTFSATVLVSSFFYHFFEKPFIRMRRFL